jgi:hypothetical protein
MRRLAVIFIFSIIPFFAQSESESVKPTFNVDLERELSYATINGTVYMNVTVRLKASERDIYLGYRGVKVVVTDSETGQKIYKKRFSNSYLYGFSDGTIDVGKGNVLTQVHIYKSDGDWIMILKEKGIY